ncbi:putative membrane protein YeaQ/YmgE (transglycosylase-associated protein family) [Rhodococcus sp. 27YEA15]|uniref:GlsB/YeaQ/YmgE family stress response membrane protein n=1 Tax=Rhodococcus sp. 27YEA15 TaxID=3156259 RepID=UPI003C7E0516
MLFIGIILFGMIAGGAAQMILGKNARSVDWTLAFVAGLVGSLVGGLVVSLIAGDGINLRPSGIIGSVLGAVVVTAVWYRVRSTKSVS